MRACRAQAVFDTTAKQIGCAWSAACRPVSVLVQANAAVSAVMSGLAQQHPSTNQFKSGVVETYHPLGALARPEAIVAQSIFYGLSAMVLLIVCLNVSGMMAVRTATRERELSVRLAIGASRARLMQYILAEALLLALLGGALAVFLIFGIPATLLWWFEIWHRDLDLFKPDVWTYMTAVGLCFVTSVVFGLLPAIRFSRPSLASALKDDAGGGGRRVGRVHRLTAAIQAGIAVPVPRHRRREARSGANGRGRGRWLRAERTIRRARGSFRCREDLTSRRRHRLS